MAHHSCKITVNHGVWDPVPIQVPSCFCLSSNNLNKNKGKNAHKYETAGGCSPL